MNQEGKHIDTKTKSPAGPFNPVLDILLVISFFTRLPLFYSRAIERELAFASWAFPIAGAVIGLIAGGITYLAILIGISVTISIVFGLLVSIFVSGALHEDGLADVADGFWGGMKVEKRLKIMRDSNIGTFGTLAVVFSLGLRFVILFEGTLIFGLEWIFKAFLASAVISRGVLPCVMYGLPCVRIDGISRSAGCPTLCGMLIALVISIIGVATLFSENIMVAGQAVIISLLALGVICLISKRKIGGQTGDVIGAAQQIVEITFLLVLCVMGDGII